MATTDTKYLAADTKLPYCRGCGHSLVIRHLSGALEQMDMSPRSVVLTTDIGCVGLPDSLFPYLHTVHTTHGRSTAFATGMALAEAVVEEPGLKPVVLIGDGGAMIGLLHLVHAAQLNADVTVLLHNNYLFGMTGGQHSAMTPLDFVTTTTPAGNFTPPLDFLSLLQTAHAGYRARKFATDRDLGAVIADAIAHPGFSVVEVLELCPAYAGKKNQLTGRRLKELTERQGLAVGKLEADSERPDFKQLYTNQEAFRSGSRSSFKGTEVVAEADLQGELRIVMAGSAGERVQSAARLLCQAGLSAGLYATQKNDYPVTIGTGFSLSEVCLSPNPIEYTGMESPDVVIVASEDGWAQLQGRGHFAGCRPETLLILDETLATPVAAGRVIRLPLRQEAGPNRAALAAIAVWLNESSRLPAKAWEAAVAGLPKAHQGDAQKAWEIGMSLAESVTR